MSDFDKFHAATSTEDFKFINHNEADYTSFKNFQNKLNEKFSEVEKRKELDTRKENLKTWDENLSSRWRGASLVTMAKNGDSASKTALKLMNKGKIDNYFISGESGVGKTYLAYAIARRYIGLGYISPSQVKIISEEKIMSYALTGFEGRAKFDELFKPKYRLFLLDNVGSKESYDARREIPFWEQLIDHIYTNDLSAIFTSNEPAMAFARILNNSGDSKFRHMVNGRVITREGSRTPDLEPQDYRKSSNPKDSILDQFES